MNYLFLYNFHRYYFRSDFDWSRSFRCSIVFKQQHYIFKKEREILITFDFPNRITTRFNQSNLFQMQQQMIVWKPIDDPKQNIWRQFQRRHCETNTNNIFLNITHQSNTEFALNSTQCLPTNLFSFDILMADRDINNNNNGILKAINSQ